ncbi:hypothetical protein O181_046373 [Austropuccinia psidii MF-1]|uniref:Uncharacterized protein n=1 Tax=Austropuccinia psidii MF-1 TaxID=1389203 RepID=A0A9Q3DS60_9BASI|nr:hypothetical protein [Austropuccinia psidii MF-1]
MYDGYKEVVVLDTSCTECLAKGKDCFQHFNPKCSKYNFCFVAQKPCHCPGSAASNVTRYLWSKKDGPFGKEFPVYEGPTPDFTSGYSYFTGARNRNVAGWTNIGGSIPVGGRPIYSSSAVPISRINTEVVVKRIKRTAYSPPDLDAERSDELDSEEPPPKIFQRGLIPSTPRNFQQNLATIPTSLPPASPSSSHTRPAMAPEVRPSPIQQSRASPIVTTQELQ